MIGCLQDASIAVSEIGLRRPTLEEVFVTLTANEDSRLAAVAGRAPNGSTR